MNCKHFEKNSNQAGFTYRLSPFEEIILCKKCNVGLRRSMLQQLADEAEVKLFSIK